MTTFDMPERPLARTPHRGAQRRPQHHPPQSGHGSTRPARQPVPEPETTTPTAGALAALAHANAMKSQTNPAIWFDSWGNDLRDNDLNGAIDDRSEQGLSDGSHHGHTYRANVCALPGWQTDSCPSFLTSTIDVAYKVCIDVPIESYRAAGVPVSTNRWIPTFFRELKHIPGWRVWDHGARPATLLDGDIVAAMNPSHQHAGIVSTGTLMDGVVNLPGPTSARRYGVYTPSGLNDMVTVPRILFEAVLGIEFYARRTR
jgi:hypothetical protein